MSNLVGYDDIAEARRRLRPVLRPAPVDRSDALSRLAGRPVVLKPEYRQRTGSFKIRGAFNTVAKLPPGQPVVAASAGNHAQGVALAAALTGHPCSIFMPRGAALPKVAATRDYGAEVRLEGEVVDDCIATARAWAGVHGAVYVPPFDDPDVIAGQGTVGLEILDEAPEAGAILVPTGGGGLLAGVAAAAAQAPGRRHRPAVIGVEAEGAPTMSSALAAGRPVTLEHMSTMADGIAVRCCSQLTLDHATAFGARVVTVDEEAISASMLLCLERAKAVVEPAGAVGLAALMAGAVPGDGPVVVILSGGNVDPLLLTKMVEHGLSAAGRYLTVKLVVGDRVGALAELTAMLARLELNVLDVEHHRSGRDLPLSDVEVQVTVETRDRAHHREIVEALKGAGYRVDLVV